MPDDNGTSLLSASSLNGHCVRNAEIENGGRKDTRPRWNYVRTIKGNGGGGGGVNVDWLSGLLRAYGQSFGNDF